MYLQSRRTAQGLELDLTGSWRITDLPALDRELSAVDVAGHSEGDRTALVSTVRLSALDLSASLRLRGFLQRLRAAGWEIRFEGEPPDQLRLVDSTLGDRAAAGRSRPRHTEGEQPVEALGRLVVGSWADLMHGLSFGGRVTVVLLRTLLQPRRWRPIAISRHIFDTGISAIPIVALIAFLISVIIAYMSAGQLRQFGAELFVVDLVTIGVLRELGVLLTAIIIAGRSGSAFAAEIGSMQLNAEVDALRAIGVDPDEALVLPRLIGLVVSLPLLTIIADAVGLVGGALLCRYLLHIPLPQYLIRMNEAIAPTTFWAGLVKAPVFGLLIGLAGTYRGMQVQGSSRELGRLTTVAVVQAIFVVLLADALFAMLFMEIDF